MHADNCVVGIELNPHVIAITKFQCHFHAVVIFGRSMRRSLPPTVSICV